MGRPCASQGHRPFHLRHQGQARASSSSDTLGLQPPPPSRVTACPSPPVAQYTGSSKSPPRPSEGQGIQKDASMFTEGRSENSPGRENAAQRLGEERPGPRGGRVGNSPEEQRERAGLGVEVGGSPGAGGQAGSFPGAEEGGLQPWAHRAPPPRWGPLQTFTTLALRPKPRNGRKKE